jgi:pimeloyl-ACP methyl ester carboxylesterase
MISWSDGYWTSSDGIRLHYRDYAASDPAARPPILCIAGLTRNARDFEGVAERLAPHWRVLAIELRGRGESGQARESSSYNPAVYVADIEALIAELALQRFVLFGTSLGGIVSMLLAAAPGAAPGRIAGVLLNDVGPELEEKGLDRIRSYVGRSQTWPTWLHAARFLAEAQRDIFPHWDLDDWLRHAKRLCRLSASGRIMFDYDMRIAEPLRATGDPVGIDLWPAFDALAGIPALLVRGAHSDLLSAATAARMQARNPALELVEVPGVGHAPTLLEPEAEAAIDRLLARVEQALEPA